MPPCHAGRLCRSQLNDSLAAVIKEARAVQVDSASAVAVASAAATLEAPAVER